MAESSNVCLDLWDHESGERLKALPISKRHAEHLVRAGLVECWVGVYMNAPNVSSQDIQEEMEKLLMDRH